MSSRSYSTNQEKEEHGWGQQLGGYGGGQYGGVNEGVLGSAQQPMVDGMTTQPSVGRFTENERGGNVSMFARKAATPVMSPLANTLISQDNSSSSHSGSSSGRGIVNSRAAAPRAEGRMNKNAAKKKK